MDDAEQQILSILRGYDDSNRRDILEAVAIRLGYTWTLNGDGDGDEDLDGDDDIAPWA